MNNPPLWAWLVLLPALLLSSCGTAYAPQAVANVATASPKPTREATSTPIPSPTIGYEQTAIIAIQTSNEAVRVNAMITAEYEQRIQAQYQMTAQHEADVMQVYSWTQQAAQTVIPLTATQQAIVNTQAVAANTLAAARITATADYPSLVKRAEDTKNYIKYGGAYNVFGLVGLFVVIALMLVGIFALVRFIQTHPLPSEMEQEDETPTSEPVTRLDVYKNNGASSTHYRIPLSEEQITELAQAITSGTRNFEINAWQRDGVYLKSTKDIQRVRGWACKSQLVTVMPNNELAPKDELLEVLNGWLDTHTLPDGWEVESDGGAVVTELAHA